MEGTSKSLVKMSSKSVPQFLAKLAEGEEAMLAIEGFGRKPLIDAKKKLRALGFDLPEVAAAEPAAE